MRQCSSSRRDQRSTGSVVLPDGGSPRFRHRYSRAPSDRAAVARIARPDPLQSARPHTRCPSVPVLCLGPYEILSAIGAGGMGEVYRARDSRLRRDVALKILPESLAADPERLARFQREAEVLASLNHPHIGAIYGLEEADGVGRSSWSCSRRCCVPSQTGARCPRRHR